MQRFVIFVTLVLALPIFPDQLFTFGARGRIYEVVTRRLGTALKFPGHWMYEPSVVTPSALTGQQYMMVFSSNLLPGKDLKSGDAIFVSYSPNGYSDFTLPVPVLTNTSVEDLCDMGDARPIWDGSRWHVYVYAVRGEYRSGKCDLNNVIFEAVGPTLESLSWTTYPGTNKARPIVVGEGGRGVSEDMQWFFTLPYGGSPAVPFLVVYNDWGHSNTNLLAYRSAGADNVESWYDIPVAYSPEEATLVLPDAILSNSLDSPALGDPAVGFESNCIPNDGRYQYAAGIAFYDNLAPAGDNPPPAAAGSFFPGALESTSIDSIGPRMFRPRLARNEYGYILPLPDVPGMPHTWQSCLYYNDAQIGTSQRCGYFRWFSSDQRFSVSYIEIREQ